MSRNCCPTWPALYHVHRLVTIFPTFDCSFCLPLYPHIPLFSPTSNSLSIILVQTCSFYIPELAMCYEVLLLVPNPANTLISFDHFSSLPCYRFCFLWFLFLLSFTIVHKYQFTIFLVFAHVISRTTLRWPCYVISIISMMLSYDNYILLPALTKAKALLQPAINRYLASNEPWLPMIHVNIICQSELHRTAPILL